MYERILVPLDRSKLSEMVLPIVRDLLAPDGQVILLHVLPASAQPIGDLMGHQQRREEVERGRAAAYLETAAREASLGARRCRYEVVVSGSVVDAIVDFGRMEKVDLIAMYTHDRKRVAKLLKGSVAEKVRRRARAEVRIFKPQELAAPVPA